MPRIATIEVAYGRKKSPAPYESEDASARLVIAFDPETEEADAAEVVEQSLATLKKQVLAALGVAAPEPASPKKVAQKVLSDLSAAATPKKSTTLIKPAAEKAEPAPAPADDPFLKEQQQANDATAAKLEEAVAPKKIESADMIAGIQAAQSRLLAKGIKNMNDLIKPLVAERMPKDAPTPPVYSRIPQEARQSFMDALDKLGR